MYLSLKAYNTHDPWTKQREMYTLPKIALPIQKPFLVRDRLFSLVYAFIYLFSIPNL